MNNPPRTDQPTATVQAPAKNGTDKPLSVDDELALLRAEDDEKSKKQREADKHRELAVRKLRKRFETELGEENVEFAIIETSAEPVVVKLGGAAQYKRYQSAKREKNDMPSLETMHAFLQPSVVYPDRERFEEMVDKNAGLIAVGVARLIALYQGDRDAASGK